MTKTVIMTGASKSTLQRLNKLLEKDGVTVVNPSLEPKPKKEKKMAEKKVKEIQRVRLFPLFLKLRSEEKTDDEILAEFIKVSTQPEDYLKRKIKYFKEHGGKYKQPSVTA